MRRIAALAAFLSAATLLLAALWSAPQPSVAAQAAWPEMPGYEAMPIPADNPMTPEKVALGNQLFHDRRLSGNGTRGCFFCHLAARGLTNGQGTAIGAYNVHILRSAPSLWDVGYYPNLLWDGRAQGLEAAVKAVWTGPMMGVDGQNGHPSMEDVCARLDAIPGYHSQFQAVFGSGPTPDNVAKALAAFLRTLVANDSAWARFRAGDPSALSEQAQRGWQIFSGKGRCTNCHDGVLLTDMQFHNIGIAQDVPDPDLGRYNVTHADADRGAFKTPTLLDIPRTAPYFHNGQAKQLEDAVDLMLAGGNDNPHLDRKNLRPGVTLTKEERDDLLAFLRELTVTYSIKHPTLP